MKHYLTASLAVLLVQSTPIPQMNFPAGAIQQSGLSPNPISSGSMLPAVGQMGMNPLMMPGMAFNPINQAQLNPANLNSNSQQVNLNFNPTMNGYNPLMTTNSMFSNINPFFASQDPTFKSMANMFSPNSYNPIAAATNGGSFRIDPTASYIGNPYQFGNEPYY